MDDRTGPRSPTVPLEDQLRRFGDALEARRRSEPAPDGPLSPDATEGPPTGASWVARHRALIAVAAAVVMAAAGAGAWSLRDDGGDRIETDDRRPAAEIDEEPPAPEPTVYETGERPDLLPADGWVVVERYTDPSTAVASHGVWAWETGDGILILLSGPDGGGGPTLDEAPIEVDKGGHRTMLAWSEEGRQISLQGIGFDEAALRSTASMLRLVGDQWTLDGGLVLAAEPTPPAPTGDVVQIDLAPADQVLDDRGRVSSVTRPGSVGSLYAELHEASSIGPVASTTIAGHPGYLMEGSEVAYALVAIDGWVISWQTVEPEIDLAGLLASLTPVSKREVEEALDRGEQARLDALTAAAGTADPDGGYVADLPRYVLPEPWQPAYVTDMALWTPEQRAQRQALFDANAPPVAVPDLVWTQGFRAPGNESPIPRPDVLIEIYRFADGPPDVLEPPGADAATEPYTLAGMDGLLSDDGVYGRWQLVVSDEEYLVTVSSTDLDRAGLRAFADSLAVRPDGPGRGFSIDGDYTLAFDAPAPLEPTGLIVTQWFAAWTRPDGAEAGVTVTETLDGRYETRLFQSMLPGSSIEIIDESADGVVIFRVVVDPEELPELGIELAGEVPSSVARYDPANDRVIGVSVTGDADPLDLLDDLAEVDVQTWRELVEPVNADPLRPR